MGTINKDKGKEGVFLIKKTKEKILYDLHKLNLKNQMILVHKTILGK